MADNKIESESNDSVVVKDLISLDLAGDNSEKNKTNKNELKESNVNNNDDTASVFSDMSRFTGYVSTISELEYSLEDALIAMIGISEYDGLPNLDGVKIDYENVINTFSTYWNYTILFQLQNNKYIYSDDIKQLNLKEIQIIN